MEPLDMGCLQPMGLVVQKNGGFCFIPPGPALLSKVHFSKRPHTAAADVPSTSDGQQVDAKF